VVLRCRWWAIDEEKGEARISVQDSGPGIEADRLDRLFRSFSQMDASTTRKYGGTGLGLAISQRLVELMGGTIGVDSVLGQGTTFWFTLPLRYQRSAQPSPDISGIPGLPGVRVIIVDDNPVNRQVLQAQLEGWGISSESAASGLQTLDRLLEALRQGNPFRIALLDHQMPGMDGLELAQAIRDNPKLSGTALVMLTSLESDLDQQHYQALGISRSLTKPIRQSALLDALMDALHLSREQPGQPSRPPTPPTTSAPSLPHDLRILLAEDNETNQMVVEEILHNEGLQCDIAANGVEAVSLATSRYYDLILMDCQMPEMDGYTATQHIRSHEKGSSAAHVAVIALTASATTTDRDECLAAGMDDYLTKPIVPERLVQMIEKWALPGRQSLEPSTRKSPLQTKETGRSPGFSAAAPFDYGAALARCAGNAVLVRQIVEMFIERTPQELDELEESVARSDAAAVSANAHRLKGGAATLSAEPLSVAAAALEEAGRSGSLAKAPEQFERVRQEFERFLVQAEASLAANKEEPPAAGVQVPVGAIGGKH
jgi:CheY-like chemotaxis protein/HPt (histidine-containing phosphotransfer) domain-containing protein